MALHTPNSPQHWPCVGVRICVGEWVWAAERYICLVFSKLYGSPLWTLVEERENVCVCVCVCVQNMDWHILPLHTPNSPQHWPCGMCVCVCVYVRGACSSRYAYSILHVQPAYTRTN